MAYLNNTAKNICVMHNSKLFVPTSSTLSTSWSVMTASPTVSPSLSRIDQQRRLLQTLINRNPATSTFCKAPPGPRTPKFSIIVKDKIQLLSGINLTNNTIPNRNINSLLNLNQIQTQNQRNFSSKSIPIDFESNTSNSIDFTDEPIQSDGANVKLLNNAVRQLRKLLKQKPDRYLRLLVNSGGCSGYQYEFTLEFDSENKIREDDKIFEFGKPGQNSYGTEEDPAEVLEEGEVVRLIVDELSLDFLGGCEIDFTTELIRQSFQVVKNSNAENSCGCGASFSMGSSF